MFVTEFIFLFKEVKYTYYTRRYSRMQGKLMESDGWSSIAYFQFRLYA